MHRIFATLAAVALALPAFADGHASGDPAEGEKVFNKCKSCHTIESDAGETIVKGGKTGPNLYGVAARVPGTLDGFKYGDDIMAAGTALDANWTEDQFVTYVADPKAWLAEVTGDGKARSKMTFRLKDAEDAANVWAYLVSVGPELTN